jgi:hypothetical protein
MQLLFVHCHGDLPFYTKVKRALRIELHRLLVSNIHKCADCHGY